MQAFMIEGNEKVSFVEMERQQPKPGEIVVVVRTLGLCGSDLKTYHQQNPMVVYPIVPGHEIGCEIVEVGHGVPSSLKVGMRGTILPYTTCGNCPACRAGKFNTCSTNKTMGVARPGAAMPFVTMRHQDFIPCPDAMSFSDIALIEPLSVGRHAASRAGDVKGKRILLFGFGIVGVGVLLELVHQGASVMVADVMQDKLELALQLGAVMGLNIKDGDIAPQVTEFTNGEGVDVVVDAVGAASVATSAFEQVAVAGTIVFIGYHNDTFPFNTKPIVSRELQVMGSRNAVLEDFIAVREIIAQRPELKDVLISARYPFDRIDEAFLHWSDNRGSVTKILIDFA